MSYLWQKEKDGDFMDFKSKVTNLSKTRCRLVVEVPTDGVQSAFQSSYHKFQKRVSINGFRKGKVPLHIIKQHCMPKIMEDVRDSLVERAVNQILRSHQRRAFEDEASKIDIQQFAEDRPFKFIVELECYPNVSKIFTDNLKVEMEIFNHENAKRTLNFALEACREELVDLQPVKEKRTVQINDTIVLDFRGLVSGENIGVLTNITFDVIGYKDDPKGCLKVLPQYLELFTNSFLHQASFSKVIKDHIFDMKVDDHKIIPINEEDIKLYIHLKQIFKKTLPPLDDNLAKKAGFLSLENMKKQLSQEATQIENHRIVLDLEKNVIEALIKANPIEIPKRSIELIMLNIIQEKNPEIIQNEVITESELASVIERWDPDGSLKDIAKYRWTETFLVRELMIKWNLLPSIKENIRQFIKDPQKHGFHPSMVKELQEAQRHIQNNSVNPFLISFFRSSVARELLKKAHIQKVERKPLPIDYIL